VGRGWHPARCGQSMYPDQDILKIGLDFFEL